MGKITINHFLNKSVKPKIEGNEKLYPLYLQIIVNQKNYKMRSNFPFNNGYLRELDLRSEFVISSNNDEKKEINKIVNYLQESDNLSLLNADNIKKLSENLWEMLDRRFGLLFKSECETLAIDYPNILLQKGFTDINELMQFTESNIESRFSESYHDCRIGMNAIHSALFDKNCEELKILYHSVFDFLYGNGQESILRAIKMNFISTNESEYAKIITELKKLVE